HRVEGDDCSGFLTLQGGRQQPGIARRLAKISLLPRRWWRQLAARLSPISDQDQIRANALRVCVEVEGSERTRDRRSSGVELVLRNRRTSFDGTSLRGTTQPAQEVPPEPAYLSKKRPMEARIRHDDGATAGRKEISKRTKKSRLHFCVSEPALRMNLEIERERTTTNRHGSHEGAQIADGVGPVHHDHRPGADRAVSAPRSTAQNTPDHRIENQPPLGPK